MPRAMRKPTYYDLQIVKKLFAKKKLTYKDNYYDDVKLPHNVECNTCHYEWRTSVRSVLYVDTSCPRCSGCAPYTLEYIKSELAKQSMEYCDGYYNNVKEDHNFKCLKCGNIRITTVHRMLYGKIPCLKCPEVPHTWTMEEIKVVASSKKLTCLFTESKGNKKKQDFKCDVCDYIWHVSPRQMTIHNCPNCFERSPNSFVQEKYIRKLFKEITGRDFIKMRLPWMINPITKRILELDGVCEELGVAFEYQGAYHYRIIAKYGMTEERLAWQKEKDEFKRQLCKQNNMILIEVPQLDEMLKIVDAKQYILDQLKTNHVIF